MNKLEEYKSKIKGGTAWPYILWLNEKSAQLDFPLSDKYHKYALTQAKQLKTVYEHLNQFIKEYSSRGIRRKAAYNYLTNIEYNKAFGSNKDYITIQANWPSFGVDSLRIKKVLLKY